MNSWALLEAEVRDKLRKHQIDPQQQGADFRELIEQVVQDYEQRALLGVVPALAQRSVTVKALQDVFAGAGPLQQFLDDPDVEEIWINGPHHVFIARHGASELTNVVLTDEQIQHVVEQLMRTSGRRLDLSSPFVDASLPSGARLHVAIPDVTRKHWAVNIRKYIAQASSVADMVRLGSLSSQAASFLDAAVASGLNVLVSGATQAGKTTMVRALAGSIRPQERVITAEEVFELALVRRDVVEMQCRQPNLEGRGEIPLRRLIKEALRMRPDRIIVGEVREAECLDLLIALNSGIPGMATIHANSARESLVKMCTLPLLAGENVTAQFVLPTVAAAVDVVVHLDRNAQGKRYCSEVLAVSGRVENGVVEAETLFTWDGRQLIRGTGAAPSPERFERAGYELTQLLGDSQGSAWAHS